MWTGLSIPHAIQHISNGRRPHTSSSSPNLPATGEQDGTQPLSCTKKKMLRIKATTLPPVQFIFQHKGTTHTAPARKGQFLRDSDGSKSSARSLVVEEVTSMLEQVFWKLFPREKTVQLVRLTCHDEENGQCQKRFARRKKMECHFVRAIHARDSATCVVVSAERRLVTPSRCLSTVERYASQVLQTI